MLGYQQFQPFNPYQDQLARMQPQSVTRVSGIDSARQLRLPPNSSMFALDYDDQHIYAVFTDGAGVVTAKPYLLKACDAGSGQLRDGRAVRAVEGGNR